MAPRSRLHIGLLIAATSVFFTTGASGADQKSKQTAAVVEALAQCRTLAEDAARLACYDKAAGALVDQEKRGEVVVVDQEQVKEVKRQSFGFNITLPQVFEHGANKTEAINNLVTTVDSASRTADGKWVVRTADGQVWRQTEGSTDDLYKEPAKGDKVVISRGSLGSYFMKVGKDTAVRAHRDE